MAGIAGRAVVDSCRSNHRERWVSQIVAIKREQTWIVREYGSGNAGATNTFRVLGKKAGIPVMLLDILKGWTATNLAYFIGVSTTGPSNSIAYTNYALALGVAAVMGHLFPIFAGFR